VARTSSFLIAFFTLPPPRRRALLAVFDFCRTVDDSVDLARDAAEASAAIEAWRGELDRLFGGRAPRTPEAQRLQPYVSTLSMSRVNFDALLEGVAMDAGGRRYATFDELEAYCHRVASAVGFMCLEVFGADRARAADYARDLGVALQLTNILRDVAVDFRRGRVYLPREDLARFGCGVDDIARAVEAGGRRPPNPALRAVLEHHASRARVFFARAARALPPSETRVFLPAEIMGAIYFDLLRRIEATDCAVFGGLVRVPRPVQARIALGTWWRARRRP
jgi:phytoene synthase